MSLTVSRFAHRARCLYVLILGCLFSCVASAQSNSPQLLFFTNDGCAPCKHVEPAVESVRSEGFPVHTIKCRDNQDLVQRYGIRQTPTLLMVKPGGEPINGTSQLVDAAGIKRWFASVGVTTPPTVNSQRESASSSRWSRESRTGAGGVKERNVTGAAVDSDLIPEDYSTPTMHQGVARARSSAEQRAMDATVRLKVEDNGGVSYATGTVIHTHGNESLVVTCGHVFRESAGKGTITAEYNFYTSPQRARGRLIDYDADARDIALVAIRTSEPITPVPIGNEATLIRPGTNIFSIGCDKGADPTIRHSKIKNLTEYDYSPKYDIFGRPVVGRSGGGLFTVDGTLVGVCNAAVVDVDEGIYTALETMQWQLAHVGLDHLFPDDAVLLANTSSEYDRGRAAPQSDRYADSRYADPGAATFTSAPPRTRQQIEPGLRRVDSPAHRTTSDLATPQPDSTSDQEVVILVRSRTDPAKTEAISIPDPTPELLDYLKKMRR